MSIEQTLMTVVALLAATGTVTWAVIGGLLRIAPWSSWRLTAANLALGLSVLLTLQRGATAAASWQAWLHWPLADLLGLAAFVLARHAVQRLFREASSWRLDCCLGVALGLVYLALAPGPESVRAYTLLYSLGAAAYAAGLAWDVWRPARREFGRAAALGLALPFALLTLLMALRPWLQAPAQQADSLPTLWAFVALTLVLNISLGICVFARLLMVIRQRAETDPLTGLANRRHFEQQLRRENARARRSGEGYALVLVDLDHFKQVNDRLGHDGGDAALRHVARLLAGALREFDSVARLGGEEFALLLPAAAAAEAIEVAERLRARLAAQPLEHQGQTLSLSASFGIAIGQGGDSAALFKQADLALYAAKDGGRDRVVLAAA